MTQLETAILNACKAFIAIYTHINKPAQDNSVRTQNNGVKESVEWTNNGPICTIHDTNLKLRHGQYGDFYSCGAKDDQGNYCKSHAKPR